MKRFSFVLIYNWAEKILDLFLDYCKRKCTSKYPLSILHFELLLAQANCSYFLSQARATNNVSGDAKCGVFLLCHYFAHFKGVNLTQNAACSNHDAAIIKMEIKAAWVEQA